MKIISLTQYHKIIIKKREEKICINIPVVDITRRHYNITTDSTSIKCKFILLYNTWCVKNFSRAFYIYIQINWHNAYLFCNEYLDIYMLKMLLLILYFVFPNLRVNNLIFLQIFNLLEINFTYLNSPFGILRKFLRFSAIWDFAKSILRNEISAIRDFLRFCELSEILRIERFLPWWDSSKFCNVRSGKVERHRTHVFRVTLPRTTGGN